MKKNLLNFLLFVLSANVLSATMVERDDVIVSYEKSAHPSLLGTNPYQIEIRNNSDKSIAFDSSIIANPIFDQGVIDKFLWKDFTVHRVAYKMTDSLIEAIPDLLLAYLIDEAVVGTINKKHVATTFLAAYLVFKPIKSFVQRIYVTKLKTFRGTVTLKPDESIERVFWLKIPKNHIKINFDAIKVLK